MWPVPLALATTTDSVDHSLVVAVLVSIDKDYIAVVAAWVIAVIDPVVHGSESPGIEGAVHAVPDGWPPASACHRASP